MASRNTVSVDLRTVSPLVCCAGDGLSRFPRDTLHRIAITLHLQAELIGNHNGEVDLLGSENQRFAMSLQLTGLADLIEAVSDGLTEHKTTLHPGEIPVELGKEETDKLQILAARRQTSVCSVAQAILTDHLRGFRPEVKP